MLLSIIAAAVTVAVAFPVIIFTPVIISSAIVGAVAKVISIAIAAEAIAIPVAIAVARINRGCNHHGWSSIVIYGSRRPHGSDHSIRHSTIVGNPWNNASSKKEGNQSKYGGEGRERETIHTV